MNNFGCPFEIGDIVKPSGISHAPELDLECGLTDEARGVINGYSIVDGSVQMVGVCWTNLDFESPYLLDEIVKVTNE